MLCVVCFRQQGCGAGPRGAAGTFRPRGRRRRAPIPGDLQQCPLSPLTPARALGGTASSAEPAECVGAMLLWLLCEATTSEPWWCSLAIMCGSGRGRRRVVVVGPLLPAKKQEDDEECW